MASIQISGWGVNRTYTLTVTESSYNVKNNTSVVNWTLSASGDGSWYDYYLYASVNGTKVYSKSGSWADGAFPAATGSTSGSLTVTHNSDGKKSISFYIEGYAYQYSTKSNSGTLNLTALDRTAPVVSFTVSNLSTTGFSINITSSNAVATGQSFAYQLNGGSWVYCSSISGTNVTTQTMNITGLALGTTYTVNAAAKKGTNDVWGYYAQNVTTLNKATLTSITNLGNLSSSAYSTFKFTPVDANHRFKLVLTCGSKTMTVPSSGYLEPNSTTEQTKYTTATGETGGTKIMTVANWAPSITTKTGTITATLETYNGDTLLGTDSKTFTATVPSSGTAPAVGTITLTDGNNALYNIFGKGNSSSNNFYIKGLSTLKAALSITRGSGSSTNLKYNATLKSVKLEVGSGSTVGSSILSTTTTSTSSGTTTVTTSVISNTLNPTIATGTQSATIWYRVTVTDSRDYTATTSNTLTIWNYWSPYGTITYEISSSTEIKTYVTWSIASLNSNNDKIVTITRQKGSTSIVHTPTTINYIQSSNYTWDQTISDANTSTYQYTLMVKDAANENSYTASTGVVCISRHRGGRGVTFFADASNSEISAGGLWANSIRFDLTTEEYIALATMIADTYSSTTIYSKGDFCTYTVSGNLYTYEYIAEASGSNHPPTNGSYWERLN